MKNGIIRYGFITGLVISVFLLVTNALFPISTTNAQAGMYIGFAGIFTGFILVLPGVKNARENSGHTWNFGKAFLLGMAIVGIAGFCYALSWTLYIEFLNPAWMEQYVAIEITRIQNSGFTPEQISEQVAGMQKWLDYSKNPLYLWGITFTEPLLPGILMSLLAALIYRIKR